MYSLEEYFRVLYRIIPCGNTSSLKRFHIPFNHFSKYYIHQMLYNNNNVRLHIVVCWPPEPRNFSLRSAIPTSVCLLEFTLVKGYWTKPLNYLFSNYVTYGVQQKTVGQSSKWLVSYALDTGLLSTQRLSLRGFYIFWSTFVTGDIKSYNIFLAPLLGNKSEFFCLVMTIFTFPLLNIVVWILL